MIAMRWLHPGSLRIFVYALFLWASMPLLHAQSGEGEQQPLPIEDEQQQQETPAAQPAAAHGPRLTVRGVVRNLLTGEGVARALVQIEGDAHNGVLTRGDGSFEIPGVAEGAQTFTVTRPGFQDRPFGGYAVELVQGGIGQESLHAGGNHSVMVEAGMPELNFALAPLASIDGTVQFTSGEVAPGVALQLARRVVQDGRLVWQMAGETRTHPDGSFHFGTLIPGEYAFWSHSFLDVDEPRFDDNSDVEAQSPAATAASNSTQAGYSPVYFPDAHEPTSLGSIQLSAGQNRQATLTLTEEAFHRVTIGIASRPAALANVMVHGTVLDMTGHSLDYSCRWDAAANALVAMLPDGSYQVLVATAPLMERVGERRKYTNPAVGMVEFTVNGKPLATPPIALQAQSIPPVEMYLTGQFAADSPRHNDREMEVGILLSGAEGWINDAVTSGLAAGTVGAPLATGFTLPGSYWVHPQLPDALCEGSFTASGISLATEPVHVAVGGGTPPLALTLRRDCASLKLQLPPSVMGFVAGEEPYYSVWIVPQFDFTHDLTAIPLRPTSGGSLTVNGLTPGRYRVYTFPGPHPLAYRDRELLARLQAQEITLPPNGSADLTVEVEGK